MENDQNEIEAEKQRFIKNLEIHKENSISNLKYSLDRFDILIITLSSGGLVFSMGFIKDIIQTEIEINFILLKISWIFFGSSIVSNLLSQVTGYFTNKIEIRITKNIIRQKRGKPIKGKQKKYECNQAVANYFTYSFNGLSLVMLISAIILLIIFMSNNLK